MSTVALRRKISHSEIANRGIRIPSGHASQFPESGFILRLGGVDLRKHLDKYDRIFINVGKEAEGHEIVISKEAGGVFELTIE